MLCSRFKTSEHILLGIVLCSPGRLSVSSSGDPAESLIMCETLLGLLYYVCKSRIKGHIETKQKDRLSNSHFTRKLPEEHFLKILVILVLIEIN